MFSSRIPYLIFLKFSYSNFDFLFIYFILFFSENHAVKHSPPVRQDRAQAILIATPRAPLEWTPAVLQSKTHFDQAPSMKGEEPFRNEGRESMRAGSFSRVSRTFPGISKTTFKALGEDDQEGEEYSMEEEASDGTEAVPASVGESEGTGGPTLS
ncbi:hypothetical protein O181_001039 [Austropuccinia psidii MF-1]|uniref:Uncharacterized protein n=1 Tax=Austropuccinia psidii MF-1 TaxID=1389203 RepID=A0A9Q3B9R0_9BASI|nr:hypothetical protein [Austropuccinia psidii MF-1]